MAAPVKREKTRENAAGKGMLGGSRWQASRAEAQAARRRQRRRWTLAIGAAVILLLVLGGIWVYAQASRPLPGEAVAIQSRDHIQVGAQHPPYNSNPPTSGWHYDEPLAAGIYDTPQVDENIVHSLEHGYVVVSYNCDKLAGMSCGDLKTRLGSLETRLRQWKLIATPRPSLDAPVALTAWGRIEKLDSYDEKRIEAFVSAWRDKGPEQTPD